MEIQVECYSGYKAGERPLRFFLAGKRHEVTAVQDQWYGPGCTYFRIVADDGSLYVLRHADLGQDDRWTLEASRSA